MNTITLPKTQHLVVFQEVIRSGSIGSAAKELGLTQPAVSKIIKTAYIFLDKRSVFLIVLEIIAVLAEIYTVLIVFQ